MMNDKNEKIINDIMGLLDDVQKKAPSDDLISRLQKRTLQQYTKSTETKIIMFTKANLMGIAASLLLLMMVNIYSIINTNHDYSFANVEYNNSYNLLAIQTLYND